ncbi:Respiratory growth induced protein 1 [Nakaseomyces bracarensis]|uniref:Respiratory growth induced protein 1 n=1 Tax=Nakaseomyces bracarensis TaxID=273131 RepID=A0ABR4NW77_9SACH
MAKKDKKVKVSTVVTKDGESLKVFEDLGDFEHFIQNETEDEEFDHIHCKLTYFPPFVLHEAHDDPEKIKDTNNSHNKRFVRHLHQHIEKHLLKDIKEALHKPELKFHNKSKEETFEQITWHYGEETEYHDKKFRLEVTVMCHHDNAHVDVDYKTVPIQ